MFRKRTDTWLQMPPSSSSERYRPKSRRLPAGAWTFTTTLVLAAEPGDDLSSIPLKNKLPGDEGDVTVQVTVRY